MLGLGLASKVSALTLAVPILVGIGIDYYRRSRTHSWTALGADHRPPAHRGILAGLAFRLVQPVAFGGPGFWNWSLNPLASRYDRAEQRP